MTNILVADDHFLVRKGLIQLLGENLSDPRIDEAADGLEVLEKAKAGKYNLIILDFTMPGRDGLDLIRDLKDIDPAMKVLILSIQPEEQYAYRAFRLGASGCVNKAINPGDLIDAVKAVLAGHRYLNPRVQDLILDDLAREGTGAPHERLSDREFQVLRLLASGMSIGEIAGHFSLSVKTVSTYRWRLLEKMNMENNSQLIHYAFKHGLVEGGSV